MLPDQNSFVQAEYRIYIVNSVLQRHYLFADIPAIHPRHLNTIFYAASSAVMYRK